MMDTAYTLAARAVRRRFAEQRPDLLAQLDAVEPGQVAAFSGTYDNIEAVAGELGIPLEVDPSRLLQKVLFVNCSSCYPDQLHKQVVRFVERGGQLVTSDWALHYVLKPAFPQTVEWTGNSCPESVISVEPAGASLWGDIVVNGANPQWWLWGSYPIRILDEDRVTVEAASHDLLLTQDAPVVACRFPWGAGNVFHVISHFRAKKTGMPTARHDGPGVDFLRAGMRLSDEGIEEVLHGQPPVTFAALQSACTATELVAQLCARAAAQN